MKLNMVFLKNGEVCHLRGKLDDKFVISNFHEVPYYNHEGDFEHSEDMINDTCFLVDEVFTEAPIFAINQEMKELIATKEEYILSIRNMRNEENELRNELNHLKRQIEGVRKTKVRSDELIIDRGEFTKAKKIVVFNDSLHPTVITNTGSRFRITSTILLKSGEEDFWLNEIDEDSRYNPTISVHSKDGILFDPTEEEILACGRRLAVEDKLDDFKLARVHDKFLTEELLERKNLLVEKQRLKKIEDGQREIESLENKIKQLKDKVNG